MSAHENATGSSDEWYTPAYIFDAMGVRFDLDVAAPEAGPLHVPAGEWFWHESLDQSWFGFVWMNPPFGGRNGYRPWAEKFLRHGNGVALAPNRTGAPWFSTFMARCECALFISPKVKFIRPDGTRGEQPGYGSVLLSVGKQGGAALENASRAGLGVLTKVMEPAT
jgi:hypothetical protein